MEDSSKKGRLRKYLVGGMTAVLALGALAVTGAVQANGFRGHGFGGPFGGFGGFGLERALKSVDTTKEQRQRIWAIVDAARTEIRPMISDLDDRRGRLAALVRAETLDRAAIETLRKEALATADAVSARALDAFIQAAEVLTPEQRTELLEKRRSFGPGFRPGRE